MILRPDSDLELMTLAADVLHDVRLGGDTRALLAGLLLDRALAYFPLVADLGPAARMAIGEERARRMMNELRRAGYLARVSWSVPYVNRSPAYASLCGAPQAVAAMLARHDASNQRSGLTARPKGQRGIGGAGG
ncbi:MAG: hypothetical protein JSR61_02695 [Proteobacteria bacterium]|nr:hypothetical protein [Pseudomonadota bacterium]